MTHPGRKMFSIPALFVVILLLVVAACAPAATPAPAPAPAAPAAPKQPQAPAPAAAPAPAPTVAPVPTAAPAPAVGVTKSAFVHTQVKFVPPPEGKRGGTLNRAVTSETPHFDFRINIGTRFHQAAALAYNRLVTLAHGPGVSYNETLTEADLAESWELSPDGKTYTFRLVKGVKFHNIPPVNGREFEAKDVVASIKFQAYDPQSPSPFMWALMDKIEAVDKYTVKITYKKPWAPAFAYIRSTWSAIMPTELHEGLVDPKVKQIGTGPFVLSKVVKAASVTWERNPNYFKPGFPYLDKVIYSVVPDTTVQTAGLRTRQFDLVESVSVQDIDNLVKARPDLVRGKDVVRGGCKLYFNTKKAPWNDERVRQAFSLSLDREGMVKSLFNGEGYIHGPIPPGYAPWALTVDELGENGKYYKRNIAEAKRLLTQAGFPNGLKVTIISDLGTADYQRWQFGQANLKEAGIDVELNIIQYAEYLSGAFLGGKFEDMGQGCTQTWEDVDGFLAGMHTPAGGLTNQSSVDDPEVTALVEKQALLVDQVERKKVIDELQKLLARKQYMVWYGNAYAQEIYPSYLKNYGPSGAYGAQRVFERVWLDK